MLPFTPPSRQAGSTTSNPAPLETYYNPYNSQRSFAHQDAVEEGKLEHLQPSPSPPASQQPSRHRFEGLRNFYYTLSYTLGFKEKYSLSLCFFFGGALVGFCLARTMMMSPANLRDDTVPGEWFWYKQSLYKPCIFIHVYLSIISGVFAVFQFLPAIRRRAMILHRINGYTTLMLLIPSTICGSIVARRAFGGELNVQSAFYTIGLMIVSCATMGILNVKKTRAHRKWMLRTVTFAAVPITGRLTSICARYIVSVIGTYFAVWRCDEVLFLLNTIDRVSNNAYPQCIGAGVQPSSIRLAIKANAKGDRLAYGSSVRVTFGMALWLAIVIHTIGIEIYIRKTEQSNQHRRGFVLEREALDDMGKGRLDDN